MCKFKGKAMSLAAELGIYQSTKVHLQKTVVLRHQFKSIQPISNNFYFKPFLK